MPASAFFSTGKVRMILPHSIYSTTPGKAQPPEHPLQGFPVFHGCGPMSKIKPRSALALRARKPSTTNR
jgi:hypothetical protein